MFALVEHEHMVVAAVSKASYINDTKLTGVFLEGPVSMFGVFEAKPKSPDWMWICDLLELNQTQFVIYLISSLKRAIM